MARKRSRQRRPQPVRLPSTSLPFQPGRFACQGLCADTSSYRYVLREKGGAWELRIYQYETEMGVRTPETFASHSVSRGTQEECVAVAQAFHVLGDSYNEFSQGYRSRFDQAVADAAGEPSLRPQPGDANRAASAATRPSAPAGNSGHAGHRPDTARPTPRPTRSARSNPALVTPVYVELRREIFHTTPFCDAAGHIEHSCNVEQAYRSRLRACPACATGLFRAVCDLLGSPTSGERANWGLPTLRTFRYRDYPGRRPPRPKPASAKKRGKKQPKKNTQAQIPRFHQPVSADERTTGYFTFGSPTRADDTRFTHRNELDWGASAFRQNSDEFLGGPTDDDHDWRGANVLHE